MKQVGKAEVASPGQPPMTHSRLFLPFFLTAILILFFLFFSSFSMWSLMEYRLALNLLDLRMALHSWFFCFYHPTTVGYRHELLCQVIVYFIIYLLSLLCVHSWTCERMGVHTLQWVWEGREWSLVARTQVIGLDAGAFTGLAMSQPRPTDLRNPLILGTLFSCQPALPPGQPSAM